MAENKVTAYQLIRQHDDKVVMDAEYVKYYPQTPYCALYEKYPAEQTKVLVCRKVSENDPSCGKRMCRLLNPAQTGNRVIGYYVTLCEVASEKEATQKIIANMRGNAVLHTALNTK